MDIKREHILAYLLFKFILIYCIPGLGLQMGFINKFTQCKLKPGLLPANPINSQQLAGYRSGAKTCVSNRKWGHLLQYNNFKT